jgi:2'-5' RNA ligase
VAHTRWYWGVVVRVDGAHDLLEAAAGLVADDGVRVQDPRTGHITLFYAPLRGRREAPALADRARAAARSANPFDLVCSGFGEFASPERPVAWLGIDAGSDRLAELRDALCACDDDCHRHAFVPHLTLAYGEDSAAYARVRDPLAHLAGDVRIAARVEELWVAGFPQSGHPARDLRYVDRIPLGRA